jgi:preprotein translocase subunit Sec63
MLVFLSASIAALTNLYIEIALVFSSSSLAWAQQQWEQEARRQQQSQQQNYYNQQQQQQQYYQQQQQQQQSRPKNDNDEFKWPFDPNDPYSVLGIDRTASDSEVSSAFRKEMLQYHPDTQPNATEAQKRRSVERSKLITGAYRKIKTDRKEKKRR